MKDDVVQLGMRNISGGDNLCSSFCFDAGQLFELACASLCLSYTLGQLSSCPISCSVGLSEKTEIRLQTGQDVFQVCSCSGLL